MNNLSTSTICNEVEYGLPFDPLATIVTELGLTPDIISESPILDADAQKMRDVAIKKLEAKLKR